jgi:hypothetical protein
MAKKKNKITPAVLEDALGRALLSVVGSITPAPIAPVAPVAPIAPLVMPDPTFNPNSLNAQFGQIHQELRNQNESRNIRMDRQDHILTEIQVQTVKTNGRVSVLETKWKTIVAWVAGASAVIVFLLGIARLLIK